MLPASGINPVTEQLIEYTPDPPPPPDGHNYATLYWYARAASNATETTLDALDAFDDAVVAAGLRGNVERFNVFAGTNLASAAIPYYNGTNDGGAVLGNSNDTLNGTFTFAEDSGLTGDGASGDLVTGLGLACMSTGRVGGAVGVLLKTDVNAYGQENHELLISADSDELEGPPSPRNILRLASWTDRQASVE